MSPKMKNLFIFIISVIFINTGCESKDSSSVFSLSHEFKKTVRFIFAIDDNQLIACDIKGIENFSVHIINKLQIPESFLWLGSQRDKLYFYKEDSICALTIFGDVIFQYSISDFNIDSSQYKFGSYMKTDGRSLWFSVKSSEENKIGVILWDTEQSPTNSAFRLYDLSHEMDPFGRIILDFGTEGGIYNVDRKADIASKEKTLSSGDILVLSSNYDGSIYFVNEDFSQKAFIARGQEAKWGSDNNIYFTRNSSELWRYDLKNKKTKRIFSNSLKQCKNEKFGGDKLVFSDDRKYLAFSYINPFPDEKVNPIEAYRCGLIILDIESGEYIELSPEWFYKLYLSLSKLSHFLGR